HEFRARPPVWWFLAPHPSFPRRLIWSCFRGLAFSRHLNVRVALRHCLLMWPSKRGSCSQERPRSVDSGETIGSVWDQVELLWRVLTVDLAKAQLIASRSR